MTNNGNAPSGGNAWAPEVELHGAFEHAPIGMAITTVQGVLRHVNPALSRLLGHAAEEMSGRTLFEVTHQDDLPAARDNCARIQAGATHLLRHECRLVDASGGTIDTLISTSRVAATPTRDAYLVMHIEDITERKALEAALLRQTLHDPLTGLANRTLLLDRLRLTLARSQRSGESTSLLFFDLNGFKSVNDAHGHAAGDEVLRQLAGRVTELLRPMDTAARLGGDEFVVLCANTNEQEAGEVAKRLRHASGLPFPVAGTHVHVGAAIGVVTTPSDEADPTDAEALLHRADLRMYEAKVAAQNRREMVPDPGQPITVLPNS